VNFDRQLAYSRLRPIRFRALPYAVRQINDRPNQVDLTSFRTRKDFTSAFREQTTRRPTRGCLQRKISTPKLILLYFNRLLLLGCGRAAFYLTPAADHPRIDHRRLSSYRYWVDPLPRGVVGPPTNTTPRPKRLNCMTVRYASDHSDKERAQIDPYINLSLVDSRHYLISEYGACTSSS
jgi:hypothetical protein